MCHGVPFDHRPRNRDTRLGRLASNLKAMNTRFATSTSSPPRAMSKKNSDYMHHLASVARFSSSDLRPRFGGVTQVSFRVLTVAMSSED
jgi:hypothetical protein